MSDETAKVKVCVEWTVCVRYSQYMMMTPEQFQERDESLQDIDADEWLGEIGADGHGNAIDAFDHEVVSFAIIPDKDAPEDGDDEDGPSDDEE